MRGSPGKLCPMTAHRRWMARRQILTTAPRPAGSWWPRSPIAATAARGLPRPGLNPSSIALESRFLLGSESRKGASKVFCHHTERLGLSLGLDDLVDPHRPFLIHHHLGDAVGEPRAVGEAMREALGFGHEGVGR